LRLERAIGAPLGVMQQVGRRDMSGELHLYVALMTRLQMLLVA
jgi:hypothetical protein